jgi:ABC-2 type transport system ATP-binding protein
MRQRLGLAGALLRRPDLLVLDEPTNGLDAEALTLLVELLRERTARGRAAVVATHDRPFIARAADGQVEMIEGRAVPR